MILDLEQCAFAQRVVEISGFLEAVRRGAREASNSLKLQSAPFAFLHTFNEVNAPLSSRIIEVYLNFTLPSPFL